ncbi:MAG: nitroreductase family protein [Dehalococcoidia bacterium]|nr:nitroreductase family protein [Dehalococcoidia bacterium]
MDVLSAIRSRRSVRQYKDTPVPDDVLQKVLEAARWAPSWANTQCTRYVVIKDPATKEKLAEMLNKGNPSTEAIKQAPIVIVACAELGKAGFYKGVLATNRDDWFMFDVGIAMQNLILAAQSLGLGTVHVGFIPDSKKVDEIIGVPEGVVSIEMTPLGYPTGETKAPPRKELADIVFYEKYGKH